MPTLAMEFEALQVQDQLARLPGEDGLDLGLEDAERARVELAVEGHERHVALEPCADVERVHRWHDPDADLGPLAGRDLDGQAIRVEVGVRLAVDLDLADADAAGRQDVRRDAQDVVLEAPGMGLK